jgi:hypothetical protein
MTVQGKVAEIRDMEFEAVYIRRRRISFGDPLTYSLFSGFVVEPFVTYYWRLWWCPEQNPKKSSETQSANQ